MELLVDNTSKSLFVLAFILLALCFFSGRVTSCLLKDHNKKVDELTGRVQQLEMRLQENQWDRESMDYGHGKLLDYLLKKDSKSDKCPHCGKAPNDQGD